MKKITALLLALVMLTAVLTGCAKDEAPIDTMSNGSWMDEAADAPAADMEWAEDDMAFDVTEDVMDSVSAHTSAGEAVKPETDFKEKIIYSAYAEIETTEYEKTIDEVYAMLDRYGAFLESSTVSGTDYYTEFYDRQSYRNASFVIRVPVESFEKMKDSTSELGNVLYVNSWSDNITTKYTDTESRLTTYRIEEENLLEMLDMATTVEEMIMIESRLSEVRYEIESLTTMLRNWQNQVDYSTLTLQINEVEKLSHTTDIKKTYWQKIGANFVNTLEDVGYFFADLFAWLIAAIPVLVVLGLIAVVVLVIVKVSIKKSKIRKEKKLKEKLEKTEEHNNFVTDLQEKNEKPDNK